MQFLQRPGPWLWILLAAGILLRAFLAFGTEGTYDVLIWTEHASGVARDGLVAHYRSDATFNHPPFVGWAMAELWKLAQWTGLPFRALYRALTAAIDLGSALLLRRLIAASTWRWLAFGLYCVAPAALVFSAQHGNSDSIIAFALLACCLAVGAGRPILCGVVIGLALWIKLPVLVAAPAIFFALPTWRDRLRCGLVALAVGAATYVPAFVAAPSLVGQRVFGYQGIQLHTLGKPPIWVWGIKNFCFTAFGPDTTRWPAWALWRIDHANAIAIALIAAYAFLRRREKSALGLAQTITGCLALFYGSIEAWSFQYFAWSVPFWFTRGALFALCANVFAGGYVYCLYAHLCDDWLLRGAWDFAGHRQWPNWIPVLRDAALLTFLVFGIVWFALAVRAELRARRSVDEGDEALAAGEKPSVRGPE